MSPHVPSRTFLHLETFSRVIHHEVSWTELFATKKHNHPSQKRADVLHLWVKLISLIIGQGLWLQAARWCFFLHPRMLAQWGWRNPHLRMTVIARMFRFRFGVSYKSSTCRSYSEEFFQAPKVSQIDTVIGYKSTSYSAKWQWDKSFKFIFPTRCVTPKSLKLGK